MSVAPRLVREDTTLRVVPQPSAIADTPRLRLRAAQGAMMDVIGCCGSSGKHWAEYERLDALSDEHFREAHRLAVAAGQHLIADLIERGLFVDHQERRPLGRVRWLFEDAARSCLRGVKRIEGWLTGKGVPS